MSWWQFVERDNFTAACEREMPRMRTSKIWIPHYVDRPNHDLTVPKKRQTKRAYSESEERVA